MSSIYKHSWNLVNIKQVLLLCVSITMNDWVTGNRNSTQLDWGRGRDLLTLVTDSIRNQAFINQFIIRNISRLHLLLCWFTSGRFSTRWPPASLCSHATFWAMPAEGRAPFYLEAPAKALELTLLAWLVFPAHQWSDYCGLWNSVLSLASP